MASQVLSGATNASYTNNTGQNVRLIINYMTDVTSMTWAGVGVTSNSTTIGKSIPNTIVTASNTEGGGSTSTTTPQTTGQLVGQVDPTGQIRATSAQVRARAGGNQRAGATLTLAPQTTTTSSSFSSTTTVTITESKVLPIEIMLANTQSFSAVCGAYNIIAIKEDGT